MKEGLDVSDIKLIIHNLVTFIVTEGKDYVDDSKKRDYVLAYIQVLYKTINSIDEEEKISIIEHIVDDISKYLR
ncbi:hypothetical protein [Aquimarina sp. MMG016]|uniref:hypothetical protein n=1 Tax=Aquimarina sp. MMG016 TaxID=2822690 RepID=UPI001B3A41E9|nr:hypothetical protein [Aquimarina sp. MMG016]MBQ4818546.1 hypothetical protein [Aquimarina sp. MMG016]